MLTILATRPDAVFAGNSGSPGALAYLALRERGYKGQIYGTHGLINVDYVRVAAAAADGLMVPSGPVMVADDLPVSNAAREPTHGFCSPTPRRVWSARSSRAHRSSMPRCVMQSSARRRWPVRTAPTTSDPATHMAWNSRP